MLAADADSQFMGHSLCTGDLARLLGLVAKALSSGPVPEDGVRVVDLGSGVGRLVCAAARLLPELCPNVRFHEFVGVELCPARLAAAKGLASAFFSGAPDPLPRCRFVRGDFREEATQGKLSLWGSHTVLLHFVGVTYESSSAEDFIASVCRGDNVVGRPLVVATADGVFARGLDDSGRFSAFPGCYVAIQESGDPYHMRLFRAIP